MARAPDTRPIARRTLLAGGLAGLLTAPVGCRQPAAPAPTPSSNLSVRTLTADAPFLVGWRGGARDWPEMTEYAYQQTATLPDVQAVELVVGQTADSVLVCIADPTTKRVTGLDYTVAEEKWATLAQLRVHAKATKEPRQPSQPLARLDEVVDRLIDRFVILVEPGSRECVPNLMAAVIALNAPGRVIWKQPITSDRFGEAKLHGFSTFGYVLNDPLHLGDNLRRLAQSDDIDMIGISITQQPKTVGTVLDVARQNGKRTITWRVSGRADLNRAIGLGFDGIGTEAIRELAGIRR